MNSNIRVKKTNELGASTSLYSRPKKQTVKRARSNYVNNKMSYIDPFYFGHGSGGYLGQPNFSKQTGRRGKETKGLSTGPATTALINSTVARQRSRFAVLNEPFAKRAVDLVVNNVVGNGHKLISEAPNEEFKKQVETLWRAWEKKADTTGSLPFSGLEELIYRSATEGGDVFVRMRLRRMSDNLPVPLQLQVIEAEQVPYYKNESVGEQGGGQIVGGIQFDVFGKPVFYHMLTSHPGEFYDTTKEAETVKVPATDVLHVYEVKRPNDVRGLPGLSQSVIRLNEYGRYMDAEIVRKKASALIGGFIKEPYDQNASNPFLTSDVDSREEVEIESYEPGEWVILPPGFEAVNNSPVDVGPNFSIFLEEQLRMVAASMNLPMELLTGKIEGVSDRTLRAALLEFRRRITTIQKNIIIHQFLNPVFERWFDLAILSGALVLPAGADESEYKKIRWVADPWKHIHPQQEIAAEKMEIRAGLKTRTEALTERGKDITEFDKVVAEERARESDLDLVYDTDAGNLSVSGVAHSFDPVERDINEAIGGEGADVGEETPRDNIEDEDENEQGQNEQS